MSKRAGPGRLLVSLCQMVAVRARIRWKTCVQTPLGFRPPWRSRSSCALKVLTGARARAGLSNGTCHELRHTCFTRLREAGMGIEALQALAGHCSIESTGSARSVRVEHWTRDAACGDCVDRRSFCGHHTRLRRWRTLHLEMHVLDIRSIAERVVISVLRACSWTGAEHRPPSPLPSVNPGATFLSRWTN